MIEIVEAIKNLSCKSRKILVVDMIKKMNSDGVFLEIKKCSRPFAFAYLGKAHLFDDEITILEHKNCFLQMNDKILYLEVIFINCLFPKMFNHVSLNKFRFYKFEANPNPNIFYVRSEWMYYLGSVYTSNYRLSHVKNDVVIYCNSWDSDLYNINKCVKNITLTIEYLKKINETK